MKRTGLQRKTPLQGGKPLQRTAWRPTPAKPIKPRRDGERRRVRTPDHVEWTWPEVRLVILTRAGGCCELCGRQLNLANMEGHHRLTRRLGPDCPCNALALCRDCHHGPEVHDGPERARELGTIVSRHDVTAPAEVPVLLQGRRVSLSCGGTYA